ncbi:MAG: mercury resistance system periplasmic binding protein MerP [Gammaproteobacteria bacterium]
MKRLLALAALALTASPGAGAATTMVTLAVPGMTCPACPLTVKRALSRVDGVSMIEVSFERREAIVTFDDEVTTIAALTEATRDAGYPSSPATGPKK